MIRSAHTIGSSRIRRSSRRKSSKTNHLGCLPLGFRRCHVEPLEQRTLLAALTWHAANAAFYTAVPGSELESENPLTGNEYVMGHQMLNWRDADYQPTQPSPYKDWNVNNPGSIDGDVTSGYAKTATRPGPRRLWPARSSRSTWTATRTMVSRMYWSTVFWSRALTWAWAIRIANWFWSRVWPIRSTQSRSMIWALAPAVGTTSIFLGPLL
jgi:hypothetical protein